MSDAVAFPHPALTGEAAPFWEAARAGRLDIQMCLQCGTLRHPPRPVCAQCGSSAHEWRTMSGRGEVWSFTTIHPPTLAAFADRVPYIALVVRLEEGLFVVSTLIDDVSGETSVGAAVEVVFERIDDELTLPLFRLAEPQSR